MNYEERMSAVRGKWRSIRSVYEEKEDALEESYQKLLEYCKSAMKVDVYKEMLAGWAGYVISNDTKDREEMLDELEGALEIIEKHDDMRWPLKHKRKHNLMINNSTIKVLDFCNDTDCKCAGKELFEYLLDKRSNGNFKVKNERLKEFFNYLVTCKLPALPDPYPDDKTLENSLYNTTSKTGMIMSLARDYYFEELKKDIRMDLKKVTSGERKERISAGLAQDGMNPYIFSGIVLLLNDDINYLNKPSRRLGALGALDNFVQRYVLYPPKSLDSRYYHENDNKTPFLSVKDREMSSRWTFRFMLETVDITASVLFGKRIGITEYLKNESMAEKTAESVRKFGIKGSLMDTVENGFGFQHNFKSIYTSAINNEFGRITRLLNHAKTVEKLSLLEGILVEMKEDLLNDIKRLAKNERE